MAPIGDREPIGDRAPIGNRAPIRDAEPLPVEEVVDDLRAALRGRTAAVLQAPPGAGKTTIVPLRLLDEPWLAGSRIVVLEPRRLAARAAARRMASLLGEEVGGTVGLTTRDERKVGRATRIEVVTEGVLVRRLQRDPALEGLGLVVLDEVHERNIHTDLALALLLDARPLSPERRMLAMSATLEADRLARLLGDDGGPAPVVTSEGRAFPVEVRWAPARDRERPDAHAARVVAEAVRHEAGDVLVFLPGAADIRRVAGDLRAPGRLPDAVDVRPLFGALTAAEQDAALAPSPPGRRRVVLATDIAESSLTVPGVRVVVDAGRARVPRVDTRTGLTSLATVTASKASAEQRTGRAGRTEPGVAYRLWSKVEHATRPRNPEPEITQVDLAGLVLEVAEWGAAIDALAFPDPPPDAALADARALLASLGVLDEAGRPTPLGHRVADLPLHPRLARMVIDGQRIGAGWEACVLAAVLEERDVLRGHPDEVPTDAAERLRAVADPEARHPLADRGAARRAHRRATQLARRAGVGRGDRGDRPDRPGRGQRSDRVDPTACGPLLALAYPDRVAQARGGGRFRLRGGSGAWVATTDPLADAPHLVAAELDAGRGRADARIRIAAALDEADLLAAVGDAVEEVTHLRWDPERDDLRARTERRVGALLLSAVDVRPRPGAEVEAALLDQVRADGLDRLRWTDAARSLQRRAVFARAVRAGRPAADESWPDLGDEALLADLVGWLGPFLPGARGRADLERVDVLGALRARLGHPWRRRLDVVAPATVTVASGRAVRIAYDGATPALHVRAQELYGTTTHPTVDEGRVPVVVHLLSPAGRDVQVTADLPGFWAGSWAEVRKDMAGRYPKHDWPTDPAAARPRSSRARRH